MFQLLPLLCASLLCLDAGAAEASDSALGETHVSDLAGRSVDPLAAAGARAVVFLFVSVDCPISNSYAPEFRRLNDEFAPKGFAFKLVYPIEDQSENAVREHLKAYELKLDAFRDPAHALVKAAQARVTPEAAVFVPGKGWVYRGRIDDRHVDFGKKRASATQHDLRDALRALADGKPVSTNVTRAVGCYISNRP